MLPIKVGFISLGCCKNQVDTEHMLADIAGNKKFKIVSDENLADVVVINTCAFIKDAKEEAINTILEFIEKKKHGLKAVIVTGCLAQRYKKEILKNFPELDAIIGIKSQHLLSDAIEASLKQKQFENFDETSYFAFNKKRIISTPKHYAYLKIAEGCNNFCSYCAIPLIRGKYESKPIDLILEEAKWLKEQNVKELILIAQNTAYYGLDLYKKFKLKELLKKIEKIDFKWIRLLYLYPEKIDEELIELIANSNSILPYFDLPIQHINDEILHNMNRQTTSEKIIKKIELIRKILPNATIRTTVMTGFPGETNSQFEELLNFIETFKFDRLGCFSYSKEEGTKAANFKNQIDEKTKKLRTKLIYKVSEEIIQKKALKEKNKILKVIIDRKINNMYIGRTKKDAPEVDCCVFFSSIKHLQNGQFTYVKIKNAKNTNLYGEAKTLENIKEQKHEYCK